MKSKRVPRGRVVSPLEFLYDIEEQLSDWHFSLRRMPPEIWADAEHDSKGCVGRLAEKAKALAALLDNAHQEQKPLAGVSVEASQPNSPFAQWLKKVGAEVNGKGGAQ